MRKTLLATLVAVATLAACKNHSNEPPAADNTVKNERDRAATPTADNTGNGGADLDLTQKIRKAVMDDSSLSTNAHNCKIVVQNGTATLVGPVASEAERTRVAEIATQVVGAGKVTNQLEVSK
ncbi:MAG TPA: BON domain-containing protein [Kofleriaceae bacterium]|nr:BON domain-containing protein [Kofleriaceae bacterium]